MKRINIKPEVVNTIALVTLCVAVIGLTAYAWILSERVEDSNAARASEIEAGFYELVSEADAVSADYRKLAVSGDLMLLGTAQKNTARLLELTDNVELKEAARRELYAFITTSGDFASSLQKKLARGGELSDEDTASLKELADTYESLSATLTDAWRGGYTADIELAGYAKDTGMIGADFLDGSYPRLIYDGPFSETTLNAEPKGLPAHTVTEQRALKIAVSFAGTALSPSVHTGGRLPAYNFSAQDGEKTVSVSVTKQGGAVLCWYIDEPVSGVLAPSTEERRLELTRTAAAWLSEMGYGRCTSGGYMYYGNGLIINMLPVHKNGAVLYTDMIKLRVSVESGSVTGFDAKSYIMNHITRELPKPSVTDAEAAAALPSGLVPSEARMALIPLDDGSEVYCYEFICPSDDGEVRAYIGAYTGRLEDLLLVGHSSVSLTVK